MIWSQNFWRGTPIAMIWNRETWISLHMYVTCCGLTLCSDRNAGLSSYTDGFNSAYTLNARIIRIPLIVLATSLFLRATACYSAHSLCMQRQFRLSVRLWHVCFVSKRLNIIDILSLSDRPVILVVRHQGLLRKSDCFTPNGGTKYKGLVIFDQYAAISRKRKSDPLHVWF